LFVCSGTAFHWLTPKTAYAKAADALRQGGWIPLFWNEHLRTATDEFETEAQHVYVQHAPELAEANRFRLFKPADGLKDRRPEVIASGRFRNPEMSDYSWGGNVPH
jgi:hypothetical protein